MFIKVDLPEPLSPTMPVILFLLIFMFKFLKIFLFFFECLNVKFLKFIDFLNASDGHKPDQVREFVNSYLEVLIESLEENDVSNAAEISELQFATGAIIFNTTNSIHQAFDGTQLRDLYSHQTYPTGQGITASLGSVTVTIS